MAQVRLLESSTIQGRDVQGQDVQGRDVPCLVLAIAVLQTLFPKSGSQDPVPKIRFPQCLWGTGAIAPDSGGPTQQHRDRGKWLDQASCLGLTIAAVGIKISRNLIGDQIPQGVENKKMGIPTKIAIANGQMSFLDQGFKQYEQSAEKLGNSCGKPLLDCGKQGLK